MLTYAQNNRLEKEVQSLEKIHKVEVCVLGEERGHACGRHDARRADLGRYEHEKHDSELGELAAVEVKLALYREKDTELGLLCAEVPSQVLSTAVLLVEIWQRQSSDSRR